MVELLPYKQDVAGSSPAQPRIKIPKKKQENYLNLFFLFLFIIKKISTYVTIEINLGSSSKGLGRKPSKFLI